MPSVASQIALASSLMVSGTIIYAVHKFQVDEREQVNKYLTTKLTRLRFTSNSCQSTIQIQITYLFLQLRKGIKLDIERQAARKAENWRRLQEQKELTKAYKRISKEENNSEES